MKIGLLVFPTLYDTHNEDSAASDLGQRLEPSVLSLGSQKIGDINIFIKVIIDIKRTNTTFFTIF